MKITCLIGLLSVLDGVTHKLVLGVSFANILLPAPGVTFLHALEELTSA